MSVSLSSPQADAQGDFQTQLESLVSILQAALEMPEIAEPALLADMTRSLQAGSASAGLSGVAELLRNWSAALNDLDRRAGAFGADDLTEMTIWFMCLQELAAGRLDSDGRRTLTQLPDSIGWLPKLSSGFEQEIARRLESVDLPAVAGFLASAGTLDEALFEMDIGVEHAADAPTALTPAEEDTISGIADIPALDFEAFGSAVAADSEPRFGVSDGAALFEAIAGGEAQTNDLDDPTEPERIWISQDEMDLTRQAIVEQLLPLAQAWAEATDEEERGILIAELAYQSRLVVNVMELIGTAALARGMESLSAALEARDPALTPDAVAGWCAGLLSIVDEPGRDSAELLSAFAVDMPELDAAWSEALGDELARIVIGLDPALLAQRKNIAEPEDVRLKVADDVLPNVLDGMLRELPGNATRFGAAVRLLAQTGAAEPMDEARRIAHTLKGDANTVGIAGLANLTHSLEDILIAVSKHPHWLNADVADVLTVAGDCVEEIADHLLGRGPAPDYLLDLYQRVLDTANALTDGGMAAQRSPVGTAEIAEPQLQPPTAQQVSAEIAGPVDALPASLETGMAASGIQSLNVPSALLDQLQGLAGETLVTARQIDQQLDGLNLMQREQRQGIRNTHELIGRLDDLVALRGAALQSTAQKAGVEVDPLEIDQYNELHVISRQLLEAHADSSEFMRRIERAMNLLSDLRSEQEQLNRELQRTIQRTRTVPFGQVSARLQRIVRQTAKQLMKPVRLELIGEEIPLDAELLERIVEPLAHVLRNAIDHGIETPQQRLAAGKPESGLISIRVGVQGDSALIEINDDGRGLDLDAIRARALGAGLLTADQAADDRLLTRLILMPGFSTRATASEVSGRGIGMDVVNQRVAALRGSLQLHSEPGRGMRVQLRMPLTQSLANVIVARSGQQVTAVVATSVERMIGFAAGECSFDDARSTLRVRTGDEILPALPINAFYGDAPDPAAWLETGGMGLLVRDADGKGSVVLVRGIDEVRSAVVKPISAYLPPIPAVRGITQLGDGGLAPVVDLDVLLQSLGDAPLSFGGASLAPAASTIRVVVADDSLSVRRALEQLMLDAGFEVATARDGFEALAQVQAKPTHALLVDLEMPRMNGLEVTRNLRNHIDTRDLPVVMITSRATDKHQAMAEQAGVTRMLGKPFSEDSLVMLVRELIAERDGAGASA
jgi:chemosensory pili system protein ChpA (sensor histidine kinase/response regulator)